MAGTSSRGWYVGDRVELSPTGRKADTVMATIVGFDDMRDIPGVRVEFDREVNGTTNTYATYNELTRIVETDVAALEPRGAIAGLIAVCQDGHYWKASAFFFAVALFALFVLWVLNKIEGASQ